MDQGTLEIIFYILAITIPFISGTLIEKSHYKSIRAREDFLINTPTINSDCDFNHLDDDFEIKLVTGSVIIAVDNFKVALASLINFFGGNISAFESVGDRARREAVLRLKEKARNCDAIMNLRLETVKIGVNKIETLAYATAIYHKNNQKKYEL